MRGLTRKRQTASRPNMTIMTIPTVCMVAAYVSRCKRGGRRWFGLERTAAAWDGAGAGRLLWSSGGGRGGGCRGEEAEPACCAGRSWLGALQVNEAVSEGLLLGRSRGRRRLRECQPHRASPTRRAEDAPVRYRL